MTGTPSGDRLFDLNPGLNVHTGDPETSRQAAFTVNFGSLCGKILTEWQPTDGRFTDLELAEVCGMDRHSFTKRRSDLKREGFVADSGERRQSPAGRPQVVWMLTERGVRKATELQARGVRR